MDMLQACQVPFAWTNHHSLRQVALRWPQVSTPGSTIIPTITPQEDWTSPTTTENLKETGRIFIGDSPQKKTIMAANVGFDK